VKYLIHLLKIKLEFLLDIWFFILGHKRDKALFERKENLYKPIKAFFSNKFKIKFKEKVFKETKENKSVLRKFISLLVLIFVILLIRHSVIEPYKIPTGSMIPTMKIGDHLFVNKLAFGFRLPFIKNEVKTWSDPKRGDIVIFDPPLDNGKIYVKRIVGVPGDKITVKDKNFYVNGIEVNKIISTDRKIMKDVMDQTKYSEINYDLYIEEFFDQKNYVLYYKHRDYLYMKFNLEVVVPEGKYFMIGDNRDNSEDSRVWGFVPRNRIYGKVMFVWLSLNWDNAFTPAWIRYDRFGKIIK